MAQVPATPKMRRARLLLTAALFGEQAALRVPGLAASERCALRIRSVAADNGGPAEQVIFLIPLVGRHHVGNWGAVTDRLQRTLNSLIGQTRPDWQAVICCQECPPLPDDPRITHLAYSDDTPGNDKWRKLAALCNALPGMNVARGYAMSFDADDLAHPGLVDLMLAGQAPGGWLVEDGYVRDVSTGQTARAGAPTLRAPLRKPFWKLCGSCTALRFDLAATPDFPDFLREMTQHEHRMFPYLARLAGRRLTALPAPAVMYELNHGENFGARRGRVGFKTRFVQRFLVRDPQEIARLEQDFPA